MKKFSSYLTSYLLLLTSNFLLLSACLTACSNDYDDPPEQPGTHQNETPTDSTIVNPQGDTSDDYTVIHPVPVSNEVKAFFDEALPLPDIYGNVGEADFIMDAEQYADHAGWPVYHVINDRSEFQERYKGSKHLPDIDFDHHTLIIGHCLMGTPSSIYPSFFGINIHHFRDHNEINLIEENFHYYGGPIYAFFWGFFPKMEGSFSGFKWNNQKWN